MNRSSAGTRFSTSEAVVSTQSTNLMTRRRYRVDHVNVLDSTPLKSETSKYHMHYDDQRSCNSSPQKISSGFKQTSSSYYSQPQQNKSMPVHMIKYGSRSDDVGQDGAQISRSKTRSTSFRKSRRPTRQQSRTSARREEEDNDILDLMHRIEKTALEIEELKISQCESQDSSVSSTNSLTTAAPDRDQTLKQKEKSHEKTRRVAPMERRLDQYRSYSETQVNSRNNLRALPQRMLYERSISDSRIHQPAKKIKSILREAKYSTSSSGSRSARCLTNDMNSIAAHTRAAAHESSRSLDNVVDYTRSRPSVHLSEAQETDTMSHTPFNEHDVGKARKRDAAVGGRVLLPRRLS